MATTSEIVRETARNFDDERARVARELAETKRQLERSEASARAVRRKAKDMYGERAASRGRSHGVASSAAEVDAAEGPPAPA